MKLAKKVALNTTVLSVGKLLGAVAGIVSVGLTTRYLGVSAYGDLTIATAFIALASIFIDFGIFTIAAREIAKHPADRSRYVSTVFNMGMAVAVVVVAAALGVMLLLYPGSERVLVRQGITILALQLFLTAPISTIGAYFISQQRAYLSMVAELTGRLLALGLLVVAVTSHWGFNGIVGTYVAASVINVVGLAVLSHGDIRLRLSVDLTLWRTIVRWAIPLGAILIINLLYLRIDTLLLSVLRPSFEVALYGVAYKVVEVLMALPGYFMLTLFPDLARQRAFSDRLNELVRKAFAVMQIASVPVLAYFVIFAPEIVRVIAGPQYQGSALALQLLMIGVALSFYNAVFGSALVALNRQRQMLLPSLSILVVNVILNAFLIPLWGLYGAAVAVALTEVVGVVVVMVIYAQVGRLPALFRWRRVGLASAVLAGGLLLKTVAPLNGLSPVVLLLLGGLATPLLYGGSLALLRAIPEEITALWPWRLRGSRP